MGDLFQYIGMAYTAIAGALLVVEGLKALAALNGADGPEDRALSATEKFLHSASDVLAKFGPDLRPKS